MNIFKSIFGSGMVIAPSLPPKACNTDVIYHAVLRELTRNQNVDGMVLDSLETLRVKNKNIKKIREWSSKLEDKIVCSKYAEWLDHFERQNDGYIQERLNPKPPRPSPSEYEIMTEKILECEQESPLPRYKEKP
jgi:hypothetical protein